jgi:gamma-glutamylcyclotransferase
MSRLTFRYFAYGSNMLPARLSDRCRSARLVGTGIATNFGLEFSKVSKDGSGKATLVAVTGLNVPGAIFEVNASELEALDKYEGLGSGYRRDDAFMIEAGDLGGTLLASTYIATSLDAELKPFDWYLATVIAGAEYHGVNPAHIAALRGTSYTEDSDLDRKTRVAAIKAMRDDGVDDYRTLLIGLE